MSGGHAWPGWQMGLLSWVLSSLGSRCATPPVDLWQSREGSRGLLTPSKCPALVRGQRGAVSWPRPPAQWEGSGLARKPVLGERRWCPGPGSLELPPILRSPVPLGTAGEHALGLRRGTAPWSAPPRPSASSLPALGRARVVPCAFRPPCELACFTSSPVSPVSGTAVAPPSFLPCHRDREASCVPWGGGVAPGTRAAPPGNEAHGGGILACVSLAAPLGGVTYLSAP